MNRTFDRIVKYDDESRNHPIRTATSLKPRSWTWTINSWFDQGQEGECVGYGHGHLAAAKPKPLPVTQDYCHMVYHEAQFIDEWAGENYEGTSVLAGAKAAKIMTVYSEYRWAFSLDQAVLGLSWDGPGVLGCWWYEGMWDTDENGFIHPTGDRVGGHAICVPALNIQTNTVILHNSWGKSWGINGRAMMTFKDFEFLLHDQGEFCIPTKR